VPKYVHNPEMKYNQILVPTIDTTRTTWLLNLMVSIKRPVVLVGETGTSKTATIQVSWNNVGLSIISVLLQIFRKARKCFCSTTFVFANFKFPSSTIFGEPFLMHADCCCRCRSEFPLSNFFDRFSSIVESRTFLFLDQKICIF